MKSTERKDDHPATVQMEDIIPHFNSYYLEANELNNCNFDVLSDELQTIQNTHKV